MTQAADSASTENEFPLSMGVHSDLLEYTEDMIAGLALMARQAGALKLQGILERTLDEIKKPHQ